MDLIMDGLLLAATAGAALYCYVLAGRLRRFTALDSGMGGAIALLSGEVDEMTRALERAGAVAGASETHLERLTRDADRLAGRLEILVASLHDLPPETETRAEAPSPPPPKTPKTSKRRRYRYARSRCRRSAVEACA